ncbi:PREDICTED: probable long-chain-alcohol O-fatty-acyltransferase 5 [Ipomoea nil]|uniref:probable long-chain-alcohol O-fatty-acyltransferase 5 n=1 Tax=Ipomoea nil TaxID=35883 RepID=UPI000900CED0|nr:PREDICTED: probable long-chain-alcohol O-fatty-acyltransferase 5 [Ipomoea nil]
MEDDEVKNLTYIWISVSACLLYCYFISAKIPKGTLRLISLSPVFYLFTILPLFLSSAVLAAVVSFFFTWLSNFKLLLFAFDRGPLSPSVGPPKSLFVFAVMASLPIRLKRRRSSSNHRSTKKLPLNLATETLGFAVLLQLILRYRDSVHPKLVMVAYCGLVFLMIDILVAASSFVVRALVGLELDPPSDEPYLSGSLQEFWGRRWNLTVTNALRLTVYDPAREISAGVVGDEWASLPAVLATFVVSGLMHELLFYYVTRASPSWEMTLFFVLHGICVAVEVAVKRALRDKWRLSRLVSGPLTVGFVVATSFWLFFPPLIRTGVDTKVLGEFGICMEFIKSKLLSLATNNTI